MNISPIKFITLSLCVGALLIGCSGNSSQIAQFAPAANDSPVARPESDSSAPEALGTTVVRNGNFDTGKLKPWTSCGKADASISREHPEHGHYDALTGSPNTKAEPKAWSAICQSVTVPADGNLDLWVYQMTNEPNELHAYQEIALADRSERPTIILEKANNNNPHWVHKIFRLAKYAGQTKTLFFGVYGSGRANFYDTQFIDNVSLIGTAPTPTPSPTPTPVSTPTPTPAPTATPTAGPVTANPMSLVFSSAATQTVTVQESEYTGTLTAVSSDTTVATVSPNSGLGPSAIFTVTPVGGGSATITVHDASANSVSVGVIVGNGVIIIDSSFKQHSHGGSH
jgi:hypothetical protein